MDLNVKLDTREFDRAMAEYVKNTKRTITEVVNKKAYFVARNCMNTTPSAGKDKIEQELRAPSRDFEDAPLAAIIINKQRGVGNGLSGQRMATQVEKFIRMRQRTVNFLRAGWQAAIKAIEPFVPKKGGGKPYSKTRIKGEKKGGAKGAPLYGSWSPSARIWNSVMGGKQSSPRVKALLSKGLQESITSEARDTVAYMKRELQKQIDKTNRS